MEEKERERERDRDRDRETEKGREREESWSKKINKRQIQMVEREKKIIQKDGAQ